MYINLSHQLVKLSKFMTQGHKLPHLLFDCESIILPYSYVPYWHVQASRGENILHKYFDV